MTPRARAKRIAEIRRKLRAWRAEHYQSPRIANGVRSRLLNVLRRLLREADNVRQGRAPGWRPPLA